MENNEKFHASLMAAVLILSQIIFAALTLPAMAKCERDQIELWRQQRITQQQEVKK